MVKTTTRNGVIYTIDRGNRQFNLQVGEVTWLIAIAIFIERCQSNRIARSRQSSRGWDGTGERTAEEFASEREAVRKRRADEVDDDHSLRVYRLMIKTRVNSRVFPIVHIPKMGRLKCFDFVIPFCLSPQRHRQGNGETFHEVLRQQRKGRDRRQRGCYRAGEGRGMIRGENHACDGDKQAW